MQVNCPNCGEKVAAENINIQRMTAVCAACDTVFPFEVPKAKAKRRKVKQPTKLALYDDDTLHMEFRTNFRLDRNEAFFSSLIGAGSMGLTALLLINSGDAPLILTLFFGLISLSLFYIVGLIVLNKTHVEMDDDVIRVTRKPLPNLLNAGYEISLGGVTAIKYEETDASKAQSYDTQRYRVWAETADGSRRTIVNDVTEDYAVFIAQRLSERLHTESDPDISRLEDVAHDAEEADIHAPARTSQSNAGL